MICANTLVLHMKKFSITSRMKTGRFYALQQTRLMTSTLRLVTTTALAGGNFKMFCIEKSNSIRKIVVIINKDWKLDIFIEIHKTYNLYILLQKFSNLSKLFRTFS